VLGNASSIALSGMQASQKKLANSANNLANQSSTGRIENGVRTDEPYVPQQVVQTALPSGGVLATFRPVDPATIAMLDSSTGEVTEVPNVSMDEEVITQKLAVTSYKASLKVIQAEDEMNNSLLDIIS
jgi:flagellar basal-body rod protein FlgC